MTNCPRKNENGEIRNKDQLNFWIPLYFLSFLVILLWKMYKTSKIDTRLQIFKLHLWKITYKIISVLNENFRVLKEILLHLYQRSLAETFTHSLSFRIINVLLMEVILIMLLIFIIIKTDTMTLIWTPSIRKSHHNERIFSTIQCSLLSLKPTWLHELQSWMYTRV